MKNLKFYKLPKRISTSLAFVSLSMMICGCDPELAAVEEYDVIEHSEEEGFGAGLVQELEVPGETFKLITEYTCDPTSQREWRITSDKFLYLTVHTEELPENTEVYIDNIHIDTSIKSEYAYFDGILQDSMDDHVHNSQMIGFPISDTAFYYGVNAIEGNNETFISGTISGYNRYHTSGSISQRRFTENDYINYGVYANKIQIVYDLLVKGPNDITPRNISVATDFLVPITSNEKESETEKPIQKTK